MVGLCFCDSVIEVYSQIKQIKQGEHLKNRGKHKSLSELVLYKKGIILSLLRYYS